MIFIVLLTWDALLAFRFPMPDGSDRFGIGVGTLVMWVNVILLAGYTFSCHSCRHVCGGHVDVFSKAPDALPRLALLHAAQRAAPDVRLALAVQRGARRTSTSGWSRWG